MLRTSAQIVQEKVVKGLLTYARSEAMKLYRTTPRYAHAQGLRDKVACYIAIAHARYGDYASFFKLYLSYFVSKSDAAINFKLADIVSGLPDAIICASAKLNPESEEQQLISSLLRDSEEPRAEIFRAKALSRLKGQTIHPQTVAAVVGVPSGTIVTFAVLEAFVKEECRGEKQTSGNKSDEESQVPTPEKILLQKVKSGEAKAYVYEQLIMESDQAPKPVEFVDGVCNLETFRKHAEKTNLIRTGFLSATLSAFEKAAKGEFGPVTRTTTTNMTMVTTMNTSTAMEIDGEESERRSMAVNTAPRNGNIIYGSPFSAPLRQQVGALAPLPPPGDGALLHPPK